MNDIEAAHLIAILAAAFPSANVNGKTVEIYVENLKDLEYEQGRDAVDSIIRTSDWFPSIAALRREILAIGGYLCPPKDQAWMEVETNMRRHGRTGKPEFSHHAIEDAVKAMGWTNMCLSENIDVVRGQFWKIYESISTRQDRTAQIDTSRMVTAGKPVIELEGVVQSL